MPASILSHTIAGSGDSALVTITVQPASGAPYDVQTLAVTLMCFADAHSLSPWDGDANLLSFVSTQ